ncbi:224_t:CDS:2 [Entrophospora sp. SA101]|nr:224_t:CDS:2 [Entrophospora sp. SA101]
MKPITDSNQRTKTHTYPQSHNPTTSSEFNEVSGDNLEMEVKALQKLSLSTNQGNNDKQGRGERRKKFNEVSGDNLEMEVKALQKLSLSTNQGNNDKQGRGERRKRESGELIDKEEEFKEDPPSPTSPRDPEREAPVFTEEEDGTSEAASYRFETDSNWQDESNIEFGDDPDYKIWSDDEGIDPHTDIWAWSTEKDRNEKESLEVDEKKASSENNNNNGIIANMLKKVIGRHESTDQQNGENQDGNNSISSSVPQDKKAKIPTKNNDGNDNPSLSNNNVNSSKSNDLKNNHQEKKGSNQENEDSDSDSDDNYKDLDYDKIDRDESY